MALSSEDLVALSPEDLAALSSEDLLYACDPSRTLVASDPNDAQYYIDFSAVRGQRVVRNLERKIELSSKKTQATCQLFTGHLGCGKSTELRRLQTNLEAKGFHVVYFESTQDLDMADVDVTDILLAIIRQVSESLATVGIHLKPSYFESLFNGVADFLQTPIEFSYKNEFSLPIGLGKITAKTKESPKLRNRLRQYLEPRTQDILNILNEQALAQAHQELKLQGQRGLVVIVDNLDRIDNRRGMGDRTQPEYLFVDRGEQLRQLHCHVVYTIPLVLNFSNERQILKNRLGGGMDPHTLPMVPVICRDGSTCSEGLTLLRQMVLARAFPEVNCQQRLSLMDQMFDAPETLDRLCLISGGHVRTLLGMLCRCFVEEEPPISRDCLELAIREHRDGLTIAITGEEWEQLERVHQRREVNGEEGHEMLLRSLFVLEYQDAQGRWFDVNPVLKETRRWIRFQGRSDQA